MKTLTQIVLAAALAAMTAFSAALGAETVGGVMPAADHSALAQAKTELQKAVPPKTRSVCTPNWTAKEYKPFGEVRHEVRKRYGDVRILRVALCGEGAGAFFQIVIISGTGSVSSIQITASN